MLTPKNNASFLRTEILLQVAKSFLEDRFANADRIPEIIRPDGSQPLREALTPTAPILNMPPSRQWVLIPIPNTEPTSR